MKKFIKKILTAMRLSAPIQLMLDSTLRDYGWFRSFYEKESVDRDGNPLPWCSYSFIRFFEERLSKEFLVFEYGSGNSTLWFSQRAKRISSVENNPEWYEKGKKRLPENCELFLETDDEKYARKILDKDTSFHIVFIDGIARNRCMVHSLERLAANGIIVLDNAEREDYAAGISLLTERGFRSVCFEGMLPITSHSTKTTIFYRDGNCIGL